MCGNYRKRCKAWDSVGRGSDNGHGVCVLPRLRGKEICQILPEHFASQQRVFSSGMCHVSICCSFNSAIQLLGNLSSTSPPPKLLLGTFLSRTFSSACQIISMHDVMIKCTLHPHSFLLLDLIVGRKEGKGSLTKYSSIQKEPVTLE